MASTYMFNARGMSLFQDHESIPYGAANDSLDLSWQSLAHRGANR